MKITSALRDAAGRNIAQTVTQNTVNSRTRVRHFPIRGTPPSLIGVYRNDLYGTGLPLVCRAQRSSPIHVSAVTGSRSGSGDVCFVLGEITLDVAPSSKLRTTSGSP